MIRALWSLLLLVFAREIFAAPIETDSSNYWTRLNYGVAAVKTKQVCVAKGYWNMEVHLVLPFLPATSSLNNASRSSRTGCDAICDRMGAFLQTTNALLNTMQTSIRKTVHRINTLLPDLSCSVPPQRSRLTRGLFDFMGKIYKFAFGVATESDVGNMKQLIERGDTLAATAVADVMRIREGMASFTRLSNERLDVMHDVIQRAHSSLTELYQLVRNDESIVNVEFNAISYIAKELANFITTHDDLQLLELGVEDLIHGQLTPRLLPADVLKGALVNISGELAKHQVHLCFDTPNEIYALKNFEFIRRQNDLFLRIHIPYSKRSSTNVFQLHTLAIPVPGQQGLTTHIKNLPRYVIHSGALFGELASEPSAPVVDTALIKWTPARQWSCLTALYNDNPTAVMASCDFTVKRQPLVPSFIQISDELFVVSNLTHLHASCSPDRFLPPSQHECTPCMIRVSCGCSLLATEVEIVRDGLDCTNSSTTLDVGHAVNMAVLQSFYDMTNETVFGRTLFQPSQVKEPVPLNFTFFGETMQMLAADEQASYSLKKLADSLRNDTVIVNTPAEAVLRQMLNQVVDNSGFPGWFDWYTYLTLLPLPCIVALCVWLYLVNRKLRTVTMMVGLSAYARAVKAFVLPQTTPPTTTPANPWLLELQSIRSFDTFVSVYIFVATIFIVCICIGLKRLYRRRSFVYLEIRADVDKMLHIRLYAFENASRNYKFRGPRAKVRLQSYYFFGILSFTTKAWRVTDSMTGKVTLLPTYVFVPFWRIPLIREVLAAPRCTVLPLLVYSHEYDYRAAKSLLPPPYVPPALVAREPSTAPPLYPGLTRETQRSHGDRDMEDIESMSGDEYI